MPRRGSPYGRGWEKARKAVLERDGYRCMIAGPTCTGRATEVDHRVSPHDGGAWLDPANLRASCRACNASRGSRRASWVRSEAWKAGPPITLVWGPPLSGKSTYVEQHARPGDLVVDYDKIGEALLPGATRVEAQQSHEVISAARNAVLRRIRLNQTGARRIWIISTNPAATALFPFHEAVEMSGRFADDVERPASAIQLANSWGGSGNSSREW